MSMCAPDTHSFLLSAERGNDTVRKSTVYKCKLCAHKHKIQQIWSNFLFRPPVPYSTNHNLNCRPSSLQGAVVLSTCDCTVGEMHHLSFLSAGLSQPPLRPQKSAGLRESHPVWDTSQNIVNWTVEQVFKGKEILEAQLECHFALWLGASWQRASKHLTWERPS